MSEAPYAKFTTENGAEVEITDLSRPYGYQNIYHVKLDVVAHYVCEDQPHTFNRTLEKMGVFAEDFEHTREQLVEAFKVNVLPYLCRSDFGEKLKAAKEREKAPATGYGK